jgi:hypothetical protein
MNLSEKHLFSDFTLDNYRNLLELAKKNFVFRTYTSFGKEEKLILWRHDIDFSVHSALKLAKIENELGITTTYFIHLHNEFYHFWEKEISEIIQNIVNLGHRLGLHFDSHFYGEYIIPDFEQKLINEKSILENQFSVPVEVFSFHNPSTEILKLEDLKYADMINTYSKLFKEEVNYISDSNGYWRYNKLEDVLLSNGTKPLQVLTHPGWWTEEPMRPRDKITFHIEQRSKRQHEFYDDTLLKTGRNNVR